MILIGHSIAKNKHQGIPISSTYAKIEFQSFKRSILNSTTRSTPTSADQRLSDPGAGEPYIDIAPVAVIRAQGHANGPTIKLPSGTPQDRRDRELGKQAPSAQRRRPKNSDRGILSTASLLQEFVRATRHTIRHGPAPQRRHNGRPRCETLYLSIGSHSSFEWMDNLDGLCMNGKILIKTNRLTMDTQEPNTLSMAIHAK